MSHIQKLHVMSSCYPLKQIAFQVKLDLFSRGEEEMRRSEVSANVWICWEMRRSEVSANVWICWEMRRSEVSANVWICWEMRRSEVSANVWITSSSPPPPPRGKGPT
jgi:hypothetical protein